MTVQEFYQAVKAIYGRPFNKELNQLFYETNYTPEEAAEELRGKDKKRQERLQAEIKEFREEILPGLEYMKNRFERHLAALETELFELATGDCLHANESEG